MEFGKISKVILYIFLGILCLGIVKFIYQFFNGNGPIQKGTGDILGAGANLINGIVNGCSKQPDCSKGSNTDADQCSSLVNCSLQTVLTKSGDKTNICSSNNGTPPGGGINTMGCALGIGFLAYLAASLLAPIAGFFIKIFSKTNKTVSDISEVTGSDVSTVATDVTRNAIDTATKVKNRLEAEGETVSPERARSLGKLSASNTVLKKLIDSVQSSGKDEAQILAEASEREAAERKAAIDDSVENGESEDTAESDADVVEANVDPVVGLKVYKILNAMVLSQSTPSETLRKNLIHKIDKHSINIDKEEHKKLLFSPMTSTCNTSINFDNCSPIRNNINTLFSKYDSSSRGNCFKCQADGSVTNGKLPDSVFTPQALEWSKNKTFSVNCSKDNWNCSDMVSDSGQPVKYSDVKNCGCYGNGVCSDSGGANICECNPNWSVEGSCFQCEKGYESSGDKCIKSQSRYSCEQSINSDRSMSRKCVVDSVGTFSSQEECEKECVGTDSVDCSGIDNYNEWCGTCSSQVFGSNCDYVCQTHGRQAVNNAGTHGSVALMTINNEPYEGRVGGSFGCWSSACTCYPKYMPSKYLGNN